MDQNHLVSPLYSIRIFRLKFIFTRDIELKLRTLGQITVYLPILKWHKALYYGTYKIVFKKRDYQISR